MAPRTRHLSDLGLTARTGGDVAVTGLASTARKVRRGGLFARLRHAGAWGDFIQYALRMGRGRDPERGSGRAPRSRRADLAASDAGWWWWEDARGRRLRHAAALWFRAQPGTVVGGHRKPTARPRVASFTRQDLGRRSILEAVNSAPRVEGAFAAPGIHTTPEPLDAAPRAGRDGRGRRHPFAMEASSHGLDHGGWRRWAWRRPHFTT